MSIRFLKSFTIFLAIFWLLGTQSLFADLSYTSRGDRYEGKKDKPISGEFVELVSVVTGSTSISSISKFCRLQFYLPQYSKVDNIVVQELRPREYYWLDKVQKKWLPGEPNNYEWPTEDVLKPLGIEDISKLGVVVRLRNQSGVEYVTPVKFYSEIVPISTGEYRFVFRPLTGMKSLDYLVFDQQSSNDTVLVSGNLGKVSANSSLVISLNSRKLQQEGFYELQVNGVTSNNSSVDEKIVFYHHKR
jgi:hypothetical protein